MKEKILKYISFGSVAVVIPMMMAATISEKMHGSEYALSHFYHSPLFMALWAAAAIFGLMYIISRKMHRQPATFALHIAFVIILAGAFITHISGKGGYITLLPGECKSVYETEDGLQADLPFSVKLEKFEVQYYPGTKHPSDYVSTVVFEQDGESRDCVISMNKIGKIAGWRLYQADYDMSDGSTTLALSSDPWGIAFTYTGYLLLLLSMIGFFFQKNTAFRTTLARVNGKIPAAIAVLCLAGVLVMMRKFIFTGGSHMMPVLRTPLLQVHVISIVWAYFIFFAVMVAGIAGLIVSKEKSAAIRDVSLTMLYPAVFLITFGTFLGAVWANISWGNYWAWDPKETWALITLLIYAATLHQGSLSFLSKPRNFHIYCILAFLSVLITYFGVNMLLGGMHSYA